MEEFAEKNKEKKPMALKKDLKEELDVVDNEETDEQGKSCGAINGKESNIPEEKDDNISKIKDKNEIRSEKTEENEKKTETIDSNITYKELGQPEETDTKQEEKDKAVDRLEIPKVDETDPESQVLSDATTVEDSTVKEKKEKEERFMTNYKSLAFPKRPKSMIKTELLVKDVKKFIEDMKKQTAPEDLDVRIIPSNMACRFELPIDLTRLKGESPLSYLRKYSRVTESRKAVYKEKFEQFKTEQSITVLNLQKIYEVLYHEPGLRDDVMHLQRLLGLDLSMELDVETFIPVSCLMERIMLKSQGRGPFQGCKKNVFEVTSFSALNGKLQDIEISPEMMNLLKYVRGT